ncbi:MAG: molybdopterin-dependent oxidoreductase [Deinococcales bacterium]
MTVVRQTCPLDCPDACSLLVTLENGRAMTITGDPDHPITKGFACSKTYRYPERAYLETRPKYPQKRVGKKGQGRWQQLTWNEALDEIAARVQTIIAEHGAESILRYNYGGTMGLHQGAHAHALFRALGAIELEETICATTGSAAWAKTYGNARLGTNPEDVLHAKLILLWGINSLATNSHLTPFLTAARRNGAKIIHIDPYQNKTSLFADQHIRIRPGTDAALALYMANFIISSPYLDKEFVTQQTRGFEVLVAAAKDWTLARTVEATGIQAATIQALALEYASTTPSFIRTSYGMTRHEGGGNAQRAVTILPILTGQWKHRGGGALLSTSGAFQLNRSKLGALHLLKQQTRRVNMNQLGRELEPHNGIKAMFVYNCNPAVVAPDSGAVQAGMKREDLLTVVLENAYTESAELADFLLPATTFLEHDDIYTAYGHYYLSYNQAATEPYFESRANSWIFAELGRRLGVTEESVYWDTPTLVQQLLETNHPYVAGITLEQLKQQGYVRLHVPQEFLPYQNGSAFTTDGKFHLDPPPAYLEPQDCTDREFPLKLMTPPAHHFLNTTYGELEKIRGLEGGEPTAMIHPQDAVDNKLEHGQQVRIVSRQGSVVRRVKVTEATTRGVVVVEGIWWGKYAPDGMGINTLTSQKLTDLGGGSLFHNTPIRLETKH